MKISKQTSLMFTFVAMILVGSATSNPVISFGALLIAAATMVLVIKERNKK
jgi:hypothetical protein